MANMKQTLSCSRSKPPPARSSCYGSGRTRNHLGIIENLPLSIQKMQSHESSAMSDKAMCNEKQNTFGGVSSSKEVSECLGGWLNYLQMLNGLCSAGSRLSQALGALVQDPTSPCYAIALQCHTAWEELVKATAIATSAVKSQVVAALQDVNTRETADNTQQVVCGSLMTFVNLHQQFCSACCEFLGSVSGCGCGTTVGHEPDCGIGVLQQSLARLYTPQPPWPRRRWSEAAAAEVGSDSGAVGTVRRWSMPWEGPQHQHASKLAVPQVDRSRSATPDSVWRSSLASQEELQEVIQLLSVRPQQSTQLHNPSLQLPGVTLTSCPYDGPPAPEAVCWGEGHTDERRASAPPRNTSTSPQPSQTNHRASWHAPDPQSYMWSEQELFPPSLDPSIFASRKSSSSTDSSSSHSLHSRSTTGSEGGAEVRAHLYSMWSGSDLTFMKLPESSEVMENPNNKK